MDNKDNDLKLYPLADNEFIGSIWMDKADGISSSVQTLVLLDSSNSMGKETRRFANHILPSIMSHLSYGNQDKIYLITFGRVIKHYHLSADGLKSLFVNTTNATRMGPAIEKLKYMFQHHLNANEPVRVLTISDGEISDGDETKKIVKHLIAFLDNSHFTINSQAVRLFTSNNQPDTHALSCLLQINNTTTSKLHDCVSHTSDENIAKSIAALFQSDNFQHCQYLQFTQSIILKFPWNSIPSIQIILVPGWNVFWLKLVPTGEILLRNKHEKPIKVVMKDKLTLTKFQDLIDPKLDYIVDHMKILKIVGSYEANRRVEKIFSYFQKKENKLAVGCSTSTAKNITNLLVGIAKDQKIKHLDSRQMAEYLQKPTEAESLRKKESDLRKKLESENEQKKAKESQDKLQAEERRKREDEEKLQLQKKLEAEERRKREEEEKFQLQKKLEAEERRKREDEQKKLEAEERRKREEEEKLQLQKKLEAEEHRKREDEQKKLEAEERRLREDEEKLQLQKKLEAEERRKREDEQKKLEAEERRKLEDEEKLQLQKKLEAEERRKREDEEKLQLQKKVEAEERRKREEEEKFQLQKKLEAEERRKREDEQKKLEAEERRKREEEEKLQLQKKLEAEEHRKRETEQKKLEAEERRQREDEEKLQLLKNLEAEERRKREDEQKKLEAEERRKRENEEKFQLQKKLEAEERRKREDEQKKLEAEERRKREDEEKFQLQKKLEAEERRKREDEQKKLEAEERRKREDEEKLQLQKKLEAEERRKREDEQKKLEAEERRKLEDEEKLQLQKKLEAEERRKREDEEKLQLQKKVEAEERRKREDKQKKLEAEERRKREDEEKMQLQKKLEAEERRKREDEQKKLEAEERRQREDEEKLQLQKNLEAEERRKREHEQKKLEAEERRKVELLEKLQLQIKLEAEERRKREDEKLRIQKKMEAEECRKREEKETKLQQSTKRRKRETSGDSSNAVNFVYLTKNEEGEPLKNGHVSENDGNAEKIYFTEKITFMRDITNAKDFCSMERDTCKKAIASATLADNEENEFSGRKVPVIIFGEAAVETVANQNWRFSEKVIPLMLSKLSCLTLQLLCLLTFGNDDSPSEVIVDSFESYDGSSILPSIQTLDVNKRILILVLTNGKVQDSDNIENFAEPLVKFLGLSHFKTYLQLVRITSDYHQSLRIKNTTNSNVVDIDGNESDEFIATRIVELLHSDSVLMCTKALSIKSEPSTISTGRSENRSEYLDQPNVAGTEECLRGMHKIEVEGGHWRYVGIRNVKLCWWYLSLFYLSYFCSYSAYNGSA